MNLPIFKLSNGEEVHLIDNTILKAWRKCQTSCYWEFSRGKVLSKISGHLYWGQKYHEALHALWGRFGEEVFKPERMEKVFSSFDGTMEIPTKGKTLSRLRSAMDDYTNESSPDDSTYEDFAISNPTVLAEEFLIKEITTFKERRVFYCGLIDRVVKSNVGEGVIVIDYKHTTWNHVMDAAWELEPQFTGYVWLVRNALNLEVDYFLLDLLMMQSKTENKFERRVIHVPEWKLKEWEVMRRMEINQLLGTPKEYLTNSPCCSDFGTCPYYTLCSNSPDIREGIVENMYHDHTWCFNQEGKVHTIGEGEKS